MMKHLRLGNNAFVLIILVLFGVAAFVSVFAIDRAATQRLQRSLIASCERVNALRSQFNDRGTAVGAFARARSRADAILLQEPGIPAALAQWGQGDIDGLERLATSFQQIPLVDCRTAVKVQP